MVHTQKKESNNHSSYNSLYQYEAMTSHKFLIGQNFLIRDSIKFVLIRLGEKESINTAWFFIFPFSIIFPLSLFPLNNS